MGREAEATVSWKGDTGWSRLHLDSTTLTLRGDVRGRIPRADIASVAAVDDDLLLSTPEGRLCASLGAAEAARWAAALLKAPPSLADKLGVAVDRPLYLFGRTDDPDLIEAVSGAAVPTPGLATQIVAVIETQDDLTGTLALSSRNPGLPVWCVYPKGPAARPGDAAIRAAFRASGLIDTKSCAVSERLTATRYAARQAAR